jgi:hypothetical protein
MRERYAVLDSYARLKKGFGGVLAILFFGVIPLQAASLQVTKVVLEGDPTGAVLRVAGTIVRFYTLRAQSLVRDRYREPSSRDLFAPICRQYDGLAV